MQTKFIHDPLLPLSLRHEYRSRHISGRLFGICWSSTLDDPLLVYDGVAAVVEGYELGPPPPAPVVSKPINNSVQEGACPASCL